jgi:Protein of unknown function (DUF3108)
MLGLSLIFRCGTPLSSDPLAARRSRIARRTGVALSLAALIQLLVWQTLSAVRISLAGAEPAPPPIAAAPPPAAQAPVAWPARRAVIRTAQAARSDPTRAEITARPAAGAQAPTPFRAGASAPRVSEPQTPEPVAAASAAATTANPVAEAPASNAPAPAEAAAPIKPAQESAAAAKLEPAPLPAHAAMQVVLPRSARLVYESNAKVHVAGFVLNVRGRTTMQWRFQDGRYQSDLSIDVVSFGQASQGQFDPEFGLAPDRYTEKRLRHPLATTQFDWTNRRVSFTDGDRPGTAEPGAQDRLSVQFQLSVLRQVYPERFVPGSVMPITLAGTRDVSHWTFTVTGEEPVDSGIGRVSALRVLSNRTTDTGDESLEVWICEKLDWFPVRIRIVDKNRNVIDSVLDQATIN